MKRVVLLFFAIITAISAFSQNYIEDGNKCFEEGDYACALTNYNNAYNNATGKDKQLIEIKLTRAKWCAEHIKLANTAFSNKNYSTAKEEYQKVLDTNPKDSYAQAQITKCENALNVPKLRKATTQDLIDIWNDKYGVAPERRQNLINAGIDPDDAQKRINAGEGKPQEKQENQATYLTVSKDKLYFLANDNTTEIINVYTNANTYSVPLDYLPSWCSVKTYSGYFTIWVSANPTYTSRKDWFKVIAGGKEIRIDVEQYAKKSPVSEQPKNSNSQLSNSPKNQTTQSSSSKTQTTKSNLKKCFNCPKTKDTWGLTLGYSQMSIDDSYMYGIQFGMKAEPLFKYGFGMNTGLILSAHTDNFFKSKSNVYSINIPMHMEYRMNFSKWFNIFGYGGVGFNAITNGNFDNYSLPVNLEYGAGLRINHLQFTGGTSMYLGDFRQSEKFGEFQNTYQMFFVSISYLF